ncbi:UPF0182 family protein [Pseudanabaena sp. FACHB-2040]|uniref:UPF0182 family protein n=1 Tax=Pseudanabaena sp. FACHB-2040 TaxID=2692859 RepID=UPI0016896AB3|nr:UPF0182 family protein [Pseudanabaena sp. FACHB-2040]MBD2256873.1 UPF0182 family protein [Pseudanabaena sp. FACHB-2040]
MYFLKALKLRQVLWWQWALGPLALLLFADAAVYLFSEGLWFQEVNYLAVFQLRMLTQFSLGIVAFALSLIFAMSNLALAFRLRPLKPPEELVDRPAGRGLRWLLLLAVALGLLLGVQLLYQGQVVASYWPTTSSLYNSAPPLPLWAKPDAVQSVAGRLVAQPWQLVALVMAAIAFLLYPRWSIRLAAGLMSLGFALILSEHWNKVLLALQPLAFGQSDPIFGRDIGFYIFRLPIWELLNFWMIGLSFFMLVSVTLVYLLAGDSLSQGRFLGMSLSQQRHLYALAGLLFLATSLNHWLGRYQILYAQDGAVAGAGYTEVHVNLPAYTVLSVLTLVLGLGFLSRFVFWRVTLRGLVIWLRDVGRRQYAALPKLAYQPLRSRLLIWGIVLYLLVAALGTVLLPPLVQRVVVQPNELVREQPYIRNSIALTRNAFDLADIDVEPFNPDGELTYADIEENTLTLDNIRLWDTVPLLESNRQLQQIRLYYEFRDADVDRYPLLNTLGTYDRRQVLVSARELNYEQVPAIAKTWVNEHLVYTHGFGFTMSPVNTAAPDGLPTYFVRGIENVPSSPEIAASIPIAKPRIYFGELTDTNIMTNAEVPELDYPSNEENIYTAYQGRAGIDVGAFWRRLIFARRLLDWRMLFTEDFTPQTRLLYRRNIAERVRAIAPFLRFDNDPYLVVVDAGDDSRTWGTGLEAPINARRDINLEAFQSRNSDISQDNFDPQTDPNYLYWIIDAYTVSDRYPYSDPGENDFNYIRNSVKVVVDAYNGSVGFFIADADDPLIQTWDRVFPGMFRPLADMPPALQEHIRYPQDLFQVQANQLMTYHMTDPQVFYNREDQWRAPNEIYANEARAVEPYYLIIRLPGEETEEFILLRLFTPAQRNNLIGWLAARSDGDRYGLRLLYRFPKQELVFGPEQIEARINQDPAISQRISLWDTQGSRAQQGNLLAIPIEQSLVYVEPLYLVAEQNRLPALTRVILVYRNRIAMAETLQDAISAVFLQEQPTTPPILRELDESEPGLDEPLTPDIEPELGGQEG